MKVSIIRRESIIPKPLVVPDDVIAYYLETDTGKEFYYDHDKKMWMQFLWSEES